MRGFKFKKRIYVGILFLFFLCTFFSSPGLSKAQNTNNWWYAAIVPPAQTATYYGPFSESECNQQVGTYSSSVSLVQVTANCYQSDVNPNTGEPIVVLIPDITPAGAGGKTPNYIYTFLQELPGLGETFDARQECALGHYLDLMIGFFIGIAAVLAMIMLIIGGLQYMTSELVSEKSAGKQRITNAILGLLLAFACYVILNSLNPNLLNLCLDQLPTVSISLSSEELEETIGEPFTTTVNGATLTSCDEKNIVLLNFMGLDFRVNESIAQDLQNVERDWYATQSELQAKQNKTDEDRYTLAYTVKAQTSYGYSCRHVKNQPGKASAHSFGVALDINSSANPFNYTKCITDMPPKFVEAFTKNGFGWGGNWSSVFDPMHFSKSPNESKGQHLSGKPIYYNDKKIQCPKGN